MKKVFKKKCDVHGEFTTGGPRGGCPQCKSGKGPAPAAERAPRREAAAATRAGMVITVDLSKRPELAKRLHDLAEKAYRTVELQVLFMLNQEYDTMPH